MSTINTVNNYNAYGFSIENLKVILDIPLPEPFDNSENYSFRFSSLGKLHKTSTNGNKIYKYNYNAAKQLKDICSFQVYETKTYKITDFVEKQLTTTFNTLSTDVSYAVKVIKSETYRLMVSGYKEACMNNEIYETLKDCISKPFFCTPFWNGNSWVYLIVTEFIEGKTIDEMKISNIFTSKQRKQEINDNIVGTIYSLWWNGYSHNNLTKDNIIYNKKTDKITLVGLSKSVAMPIDDVFKFRTNVENYDVSFTSEYQNTFKQKSISLVNSTGNTNIETDDFQISAYFF